MARSKGYRRSTPIEPPHRLRRVLVLSLLLQNPRAVGRKEAAAEPAAVVMTRARSRRIAAAAATLPEAILAWEIFVRLPAKDVLRCRAACRSWRGLISAPDFLLTHHRRQPSLPLITLYGTAFKHGRPVLRLEDYEGFQLLASCDGLLLFSFSNGQFSICNPTTRQHAPLPCLAAAGRISIAALYLHRPSGEYHVLYRKEAAYYILTVPRGQSPRCIGVPSQIPGIEKVMPAWHGRAASKLIPPVVFRDCLHWDLGCSHTDILVFDTVVETFRLMRRPTAATGICTRLCDMEGAIGFSCNDHGRAVTIWVLEDYEREVWSLKYHVQLPPEKFCYLVEGTQHLVLSHKGDVLAYRPYSGYMLHCDSTGKLLEEFRCDSWGLSIIGHWFKESLVKHDISLRLGLPVVQRV